MKLRGVASKSAVLFAAFACLAVFATTLFGAGLFSTDVIAPKPATAQTDTTQTASGIALLNPDDCSNGTFVDLAVSPIEPGDNNDLVDDCKALVALQNHWANVVANSTLPQTHILRTWGTGTAAEKSLWHAGRSWLGPIETPFAIVTLVNDAILGKEVYRITSLYINGNRSANDGSEARATESQYTPEGSPDSIELAPGTFRSTYSISKSRTIAGTIPPEIGDLTALVNLDISGHRLTGAVPSEIWNLTKLQSLALAGNQLTSLPVMPVIKPPLLYINIASNNISSLPTGFGWLSQLQTLFVGENPIAQLPEGFGSGLSALEVAAFTNNQLSDLPDSFGTLPKIEELLFWNNNFATFPPELTSLPTLTKLQMQNNLIPSLPDSINQLTKLTLLGLSRNQITSLPSDLSALTDLEKFWFDDNYVYGQLPNYLTNLVPSNGGSLADLRICNNFLSGSVPKDLRNVLGVYPVGASFDKVACQSPCPEGLVCEPPEEPNRRRYQECPSITADSPEPVRYEGWKVTNVQDGGAPYSKINNCLGLTYVNDAYKWDAANQRWQSLSEAVTLSEGDAVGYWGGYYDLPTLDKINLGPAYENVKITLQPGWNIMESPLSEPLERPEGSNSAFFVSDDLYDCGSDQGVLIIAIYDTIEAEWAVGMPCNPSREISLRRTYGYLLFDELFPRDNIYLYFRSALPVDISWKEADKEFSAPPA